MPPCKGCSKEILFVKTHDGHTVPVERNTAVMNVHMDVNSNFRATKASGHEALGDDKAAFLAVHNCTEAE